MKTLLLLTVPAALLGLAMASPAAANSQHCCYIEGDQDSHDVPDPSRDGQFISHFKDGMPYSLVTEVDSHCARETRKPAVAG